jgi:arylsulfatase A-like enzyme
VADSRPDIVVIVVDSVRASNSSTYGYGRPTTPNLDRLAGEGAVFMQATSVGCWTLPVHTSLFTGLSARRHRVTISSHALAREVPTLAERLRDTGYVTACFSNNAYISSATGLTRGFEHVDEVWRVTNPRGVAVPRLSRRIKELEKRGPLLRPVIGLLRRAKRARSMIKAWRSRRDSGASYTNQRIGDWLKARTDDRPLFLFVNYMESHEPYLPPYPYNRTFVPLRHSPWRIMRTIGRREEILSRPAREREEDLEILEGLYDGTLRYADEKVAELEQLLRVRGRIDETFLAVTSDHGDAFGEHGHLGHRLTLYEELLRVPLLVRFPPGVPGGTVVAEPVSLGGLHRTMLQVAGVGDGAMEADYPSLLGGPPGGPVIAENTGPKSIDGLESRSLRDGDAKLIWRSDGRHELYDLASDPGERHDLAATDGETLRRMLERLATVTATMDTQSTADTDDADYDDETLERLRGLGYVG